LKSVVILGAGRIGSVIARDLNSEYEVLVLDIDSKRLDQLSTDYNLKTENLDFTVKSGLAEKLYRFDLVINALPGFMGFEMLKTIIESKKDVVDISFFNEDPYKLDLLARENNVTAVVDCGVAPGLCNIILGHHVQKSKVKSYKCFVGGLPFDRVKPFEYKAPFSPMDVIEEYTRPARVRINGKEIIKEALSEIEDLYFEQTGKLEAFNTDGLRTLITTTEIPNLQEKTIRYPGHAKLMLAFRETGLFGDKKITINEKEIRPIDLTRELLFKHWNLKENEKEFTIMKIEIDSKDESWHYLLYDKTDEENRMSSMSRTTGFTCTSVARLILQGVYTKKGIIAPELIGKETDCFEFVLKELKNRKVEFLIENHTLD